MASKESKESMVQFFPLKCKEKKKNKTCCGVNQIQWFPETCNTEKEIPTVLSNFKCHMLLLLLLFFEFLFYHICFLIKNVCRERVIVLVKWKGGNGSVVLTEWPLIQSMCRQTETLPQIAKSPKPQKFKFLNLTQCTCCFLYYMMHDFEITAAYWGLYYD